VPQVANVFAGSKRALPWLTSAMLACQRLRCGYGVFALLAVALAVVAGRVLLRDAVLRERYDAAFLRCR
jgi:general secretion pathway protein F